MPKFRQGKTMINRATFLKDLKAAKGALSGDETSVPVFSMFLIHDNALLAFNDVIGIETMLDEDTNIEVVVPGNLLISTLSGYNSDDLDMKMKEGTLNLSCGKRLAVSIPLLPVDAWIWKGPAIEEDKDKIVSLELTDSVIEGMRSVMISMQATDSDPAMSGITVLNTETEEAFFCTTDRKTICEYAIPENSDDSIENHVTLPPLFCSQLIAMRSVYTDNIFLTVYDDCAIVEFGEKATLFTRLMNDDSLPNFEQVIHDTLGESPLNLIPLPEGIKDSLERSLLFYKYGDPGKISISVKGKDMTVEAGEKGRKMREKFTLESSVKEDVSVLVDPVDIKRALKYVTHFDFRSENSRCLVFSDQKGFTYFVGRVGD